MAKKWCLVGKAWRDAAGAVREWCLPGSGAGRKCRQRDGGRDLLSCRAQQVRRGGSYLGCWCFVGAVCLDLPEEQEEVSKATNYSKTI